MLKIHNFCFIGYIIDYIKASVIACESNQLQFTLIQNSIFACYLDYVPIHCTLKANILYINSNKTPGFSIIKCNGI